MNSRFAAVAGLGLLGSVIAANWLSSTYGLVPVGFGLLASAGTFAAGLALAVRDVLHEVGGWRLVLAVVAVGIALSALLGDGRIALASALAFGISELVDLLVYSPLRRRAWRTAVVASNVVAGLVDTVLFLAVSGFGLSAASVTGQMLVKAVWVTGSFLLVAEVIRRSTRSVTVG